LPTTLCDAGGAWVRPRGRPVALPPNETLEPAELHEVPRQVARSCSHRCGLCPSHAAEPANCWPLSFELVVFADDVALTPFEGVRHERFDVDSCVEGAAKKRVCSD
jgi:hypothetical protein